MLNSVSQARKQWLVTTWGSREEGSMQSWLLLAMRRHQMCKSGKGRCGGQKGIALGTRACACTSATLLVMNEAWLDVWWKLEEDLEPFFIVAKLTSRSRVG